MNYCIVCQYRLIQYHNLINSSSKILVRRVQYVATATIAPQAGMTGRARPWLKRLSFSLCLQHLLDCRDLLVMLPALLVEFPLHILRFLRADVDRGAAEGE